MNETEKQIQGGFDEKTIEAICKHPKYKDISSKDILKQIDLLIKKEKKKSFVKGKLGHKNDDVATPEYIAKKIINLVDNDPFNTFETILDPFRGNGVFYDNFPKRAKKKYWCEIKEGRDFFDFNKKVDWIISNPPYSIFDKVLDHSFKIADNVVYLVPLSKVVSSMGRIRKIAKYGGVPFVYIISASKCGFPFGFPACAIHFQRGYKGKTKIKVDN